MERYDGIIATVFYIVWILVGIVVLAQKLNVGG
jgi:hypothetical protein